MATQAIRFTAPPGQTVTVDVVGISDDSLQQTALTSTEATNKKGTYTTQTFTDTLAGIHFVVKKIGGVAINNDDYVDMKNANGTYVATTMAELEAKRARQWNTNKRTIEVVSSTSWLYTVYEDDGTTESYKVYYNPSNGTKTPYE